MIIINRPYIHKNADKTRIECEIELFDKTKKIWFEIPDTYSDFLCDDLADAFLVVMLPLATSKEEDIYVRANVSPRLLYNIDKLHIPYLSAFFEKNKIKVTAESSEAVIYNGKAVMTACSLGVDSLSTLYQHIASDCPPQYRLTHLILCNTSQLGDSSQEELDEVLKDFAGNSLLFANEVGLPFFTLNSNVTSMLRENGLTPVQVFHYFTLGSIMSLQKGVGKYLFSSSYNTSEISLEHNDVSHSEAVVVPMFSNENIEMILSDAFHTRVEKTEYISENSLTPEYLDVCAGTQLANMEVDVKFYIENKTHRNCGWCDKCLRTLFTLELLGRISEYGDAFDLTQYYKHRKTYLIKVVATSKHNLFSKELYQLMKIKNVHMPLLGVLGRFFNVYDSKLIVRTVHFLKNKRLI